MEEFLIIWIGLVGLFMKIKGKHFNYALEKNIIASYYHESNYLSPLCLLKPNEQGGNASPVLKSISNSLLKAAIKSLIHRKEVVLTVLCEDRIKLNMSVKQLIQFSFL